MRAACLIKALVLTWFKYLRYRRIQRPRLPIKALKLWRFDKMISEFWAYFHCACAQSAICELLGPDLQRMVRATYELLMISGTHDKLTTAQVSLEKLHYNWKPKQGFRRKITILVQSVCPLAMLEGFDSSYNDVIYDEVTKTHNMQLCELDEGPFSLKMLCNEAYWYKIGWY